MVGAYSIAKVRLRPSPSTPPSSHITSPRRTSPHLAAPQEPDNEYLRLHAVPARRALHWLRARDAAALRSLFARTQAVAGGGPADRVALNEADGASLIALVAESGN